MDKTLRRLGFREEEMPQEVLAHWSAVRHWQRRDVEHKRLMALAIAYSESKGDKATADKLRVTLNPMRYERERIAREAGLK